jgi:hypothetical protein
VLIKKSCYVYGTWVFIIMFTKTLHSTSHPELVETSLHLYT